MNLHPLIGGTLALYQFQGNMRDSSGNGYDLSLVGGTEQYESFDACTSGIKLNGATWMRSLPAPALQYTGSHTVEVLAIQRQSFQQSWFKVDQHDTPNVSGIWQYYLDSGNRYAWQSQNGDLYVGFPGPALTCGPYVIGGTSNHTVFHFAWRKTLLSPTTYRIELLVNGVLMRGMVITGTLSVGPNHCMWVAGTDFSAFNNVFEGAMASVRVVNYPRTDLQIAADAAFTLGTCGLPAVPPVTDGTSGTSTFTGTVYDGVAAAQFAQAIRQAPRIP